MWEYTDSVKEHFLRPKNVGTLEDANGIGEVGSLACGDALKLFIKVEDNVIVDASFLTFGCASAIASSSALTEMLKGKTLEEAKKITNKDIAASLGGLPKEKMHCSVMGEEALEAAIRNYLGEPAMPHTHEGKLVCRCFGVTDAQIIKAIQENNLTTPEEVTHYTKAGGGCGDCLEQIKEILESVGKGIAGEAVASLPDLRPRPAANGMSNIQRMKKVMDTLDDIIRPRLLQDGGDIELVDIEGTIVSVVLRGTCTNCPSSKITIEGFVQQTLQDQVDPAITVREVKPMKRIVYLDNNATTAVDPKVVNAMVPYLTEYYGNPSSMHTFGGQVGRAIQKARKQIANLIKAAPEEITFTSCGTESDSTAIYAALNAQPEKKHFITTRVEHPAILSVAQHLEKRGYTVTYLAVDGLGNIDLKDLENALNKNTALVSIMFANNETGVLFPIVEAARLCKQKGVLFHTDAIQAVGKIPIDLTTLPVDYLSISGHKLHAPKGIGALYVRRGAPFRPFLRGGHQERGRRAGTEAVPAVVALGEACEIAASNIEHENTAVKALRDKLEKNLLELIPEAVINGDRDHRLPNTFNISFKHVEGEAILLLLDEFGICASSGSACTSGSLEPSHVLRAMGVPFTYAHGSIRFSLSRFTTEEDIDLVIKELPPIIQNLRAISPFSRA